MKGRVLIVAGSDSGGGAGIQADIKTVTALGGYAATAITALTAQNTQGVFGIETVPVPFIRQQMRLVLDDIGADCLKLGMLHSSAVIDAVIAELGEAPVPLVIDPVMVAKGGSPLLRDEAVATLRARLLPLASVLTPNLPEAELLLGCALPDLAARRKGAVALRGLGAAAVLLKGGHAEGDLVVDVLATAAGIVELAAPRIATRHTHGTGCTLASAIATGIAQGMDVVRAVERARAYLRLAIQTAPGFGLGHGPLNHAVTVRPLPGFD